MYRLNETINMLEQNLRAHERILRGVQGFFAGSENVLPGEFRQYIKSLELGSDFSGLRGIGYCLIKTPRDNQLLDFSCPVVQIEPEIGQNRLEVGTDLYANPIMRQAMEASRKSGNIAMSGKLEAPSASQSLSNVGFALFLPIFKAGTQPATIEQRQKNISGWIYESFFVNDLMDSLYGRNAPEINIKLYDGIEISQRSLLFDSNGTGNPISGTSISATEYLKVSGRTWTLTACNLPGFESRFGKDSSSLIVVVGIVLTYLLGSLVWILETSRSRALSLAEKMTRELRETKDHFELIFRTNPDITIISRLTDGLIVNVNESFTKLTGYSAAEAIGKTTGELNLWVNKDEHKTLVRNLRKTGSCDDLEAQFFNKEGKIFYGILSGRITTIHGIPHAISVTRDISDRKRHEELIRHMAQHDFLTDLPNRALFTDLLLQTLARAKREKTRAAVIFIDLDQFKPVNDNYGHLSGDLVLKEVARRILSCLRQSDTVGRIGGDEFVILLVPIEGMAEAEIVAEKLCAAINQPFDIALNQNIRISCSVGIAIYPDDGNDDKELIKKADLAMYANKAKNPGADHFPTTDHRSNG